MRCDDVIQALETPGGGRDDLEISHHLAGCEACARRVDQAARFDRLWEATRATDPTPGAWDHVWAGVQADLDQPQAARPWRGVTVVGLSVMALAAAVLLAFGLLWQGADRPRVQMPAATDLVTANRTSTSPDAPIEVEDGQVILIRSKGSNIEIVDLTSLELPDGEDPWYVFFNRVESAGTVVVMTE